jgi:hypothetical protein
MDGDKRHVALDETATFSSSLSLGLKLLQGTTQCPPKTSGGQASTFMASVSTRLVQTTGLSEGRGSGLTTAGCRIVGADLDDRSTQAFCVVCEYRASFGAKPICEVALPEMELRSSLLGHLADL